MQYRNASDDVEHLLDFWAQCVLNTADGSLHSDTVGKTTYLKMSSYTFANSQAVGLIVQTINDFVPAAIFYYISVEC